MGASTLMSAAFVAAWVWPSAVIRRRRALLGALAVLTAAAVFAIVRPHAPGGGITLDPSEEPLLPVTDPSRDVYAEAVRNFGDDDVMVIGMDTGGVFTHEHLEALRRITERVRQLPGVRATDSLIDATAFRYDAAADLVTVERFIATVP